MRFKKGDYVKFVKEGDYLKLNRGMNNKYSIALKKGDIVQITKINENGIGIPNVVFARLDKNLREIDSTTNYILTKDLLKFFKKLTKEETILYKL